MPEPSPTKRLLEVHVKEGLDEYVTRRRHAGKSWRVIARELHAMTGVDVSHEALRRWFKEANGGEAA